ncbi:MAG: hypothetical protein JXX28_03840 [Deltaproteobacteria bacterium]|nr:hypothetical protein [Deltaproteobacteria bacterium]
MLRSTWIWLPLTALACNHDDGITRYNADPVAAILSHQDHDQIPEGQLVTFRGTGSDPDLGDTLTAVWYAGEDVLCPSAPVDANGNTACAALLSMGQDAITLEVRDQENAAGSAQVEIEVVPGGTPAVEIASPQAGGTYYADQLLSFMGTVQDAEDAPGALTAWWESSLSGELELNATADASGMVSATGYLSAGEHELSLHATDTTGKTGRDQVLLTVLPANTAPWCEITAPPDGTVGEPGAPVRFEGVVGDADQSAGSLVVSWTSDAQGSLGAVVPDSEGNVSVTTSSLGERTHRVTLKVVDDKGLDCTDDVLYTVGSPPSVSLSAPAGGTVFNAGDSVHFQGVVSDPDSAPGDLSLSWTSSLDGAFSTQGPDGSGNLSLTTSSLSVGSHTITVEAEDPDHFYGRAQVAIRVNGAPGAPAVELFPAAPRTADPLVVHITRDAVDPDADPVSYAYRWFRDGAPSSASTTDTLSASATAKGQTWRVEVTPSDAWASGAVATASVQVANTPPTQPGLTVDPAEPVEGVDDLVCRISALSTDADGDAVSYTLSWDYDGNAFGGASTTSRVGDTIEASYTEAEELWTCSAVPSDGASTGLAGEASALIRGEPVDWAALETCAMTLVASGHGDAEAWVFHFLADGTPVTQASGQGPGIEVQIGHGPDGTLPAGSGAWVWFAAHYDRDADGLVYGDKANDVYRASLSAPSAVGSYDLAARVTTDGGISWVYADLGHLCGGKDGTRDGYTSANAGELTVTAH